MPRNQDNIQTVRATGSVVRQFAKGDGQEDDRIGRGGERERQRSRRGEHR